MELKLCPFCGGAGKVHQSEKGIKIVCENHLCPCETFVYSTVKEAADRWNNRVSNVVYGKWDYFIDDDCPSDCLCRCNICGAHILQEELRYENFCPNCGAKMQARNEEKETNYLRIKKMTIDQMVDLFFENTRTCDFCERKDLSCINVDCKVHIKHYLEGEVSE